ncbi:DUF397 domain-containing protein [Streptomyces sp. V2]|uniref:DUF397 domain-containing protein n=2 Tax=Streptomyces niveiscabiei TaxID=164115 RepID=A0ABW9HTY6_9ACTN|nr:DUF397 domain-containing protein [Streptomyces sp. V2]PWG12034.1 DUF397 domain-containing protein [Streptomyces sp. V2]
MRATPDLTGALWRKSTHSDAQPGGECVEVAHNIPNLIPVRDSKTPHATPLTFTPHAWQTFITATSSR